MTIRLRIILLVILAAFLLFLIGQVRSRRVNMKYMLTWFLLDFALAVLTLFPNLLTVLTGALGIYSPVNMIFFCGFLFSLLIIYRLTVAVSRLSNQVRVLSQTIALIKAEQTEGSAETSDFEVEHAQQ